jgi:Kef-type K+ transport system membrane component KefB
MTRVKQNISYITFTGALIALMYWIIFLGTKHLELNANTPMVEVIHSPWADFLNSLLHNFQHPLALLLAQIATIIVVARAFGWICSKIRQPVVIGEMIAGILLGPSFFGMYLPEFSSSLFPEESLGNLQFLSQMGLILFMFIVGMEVNIKTLKDKAYDALVISHASIFIPFTLGVGLSYFLYQEFAPKNIPFSIFALFSGIAMSVTAFPVLARIVLERGINKTKLGTIVLSCAAADDVTAWFILAALIAFVKAGTFMNGIYTIVLTVVYVAVMFKIVRPLLQNISERYSDEDKIEKPVVAVFFLILILSACTAEIIGIHALFGAFLVGTLMPETPQFRRIFIEKVEDVALVLLLPLFFVFTGLRTQIGLLDEPYLWMITALIIFVAVAGKFAGSTIAAKYVGQSWKDSLSIGALMNTRGLMELVVLNIGYDLGILSPEIFTMMVIMALVTTCMTGPALDLINHLLKTEKDKTPPEQTEEIATTVNR